MNKRKIFAILFALLLVVASTNTTLAATYKDTGGHWAEKDIDWATQRGYLRGDGDGNFRPDDTVTRAEVVTGVNRLIGQELKAVINFPDVKNLDWYYEDLAKGVYSGIIDDSRSAAFRPNEAILRVDTARIFARAYELPSYPQGAQMFKDYTSISFKGEVGALVNRRVINGFPDGNFYPEKNLTRGEYAKMLRAAVEYIGLPPKRSADDTSVLKLSVHKGVLEQLVPVSNLDIDNTKGTIVIEIANTHRIEDVVQVRIDEVAPGARVNPNPVKSSDNWKFMVIAENGTSKEFTISFKLQAPDSEGLVKVAEESIRRFIENPTDANFTLASEAIEKVPDTAIRARLYASLLEARETDMVLRDALGALNDYKNDATDAKYEAAKTAIEKVRDVATRTRLLAELEAAKPVEE